MSNEQLENFEELGRRAVTCKMWRWMPGMMTCGGWRVIAISEGRSVCAKYDFVVISPEHDAIPDLTDPATLGCLLALVREAWPNDGLAMVCTLHYARRWFIDLPSGEIVCQSTEVEALVAALEVAP